MNPNTRPRPVPRREFIAAVTGTLTAGAATAGAAEPPRPTAAVPVGAVLPYFPPDGALDEKTLPFGRVVCDGRQIGDDAFPAPGYERSVFWHRRVPNLTGQFLRGAEFVDPPREILMAGDVPPNARKGKLVAGEKNEPACVTTIFIIRAL